MFYPRFDKFIFQDQIVNQKKNLLSDRDNNNTPWTISEREVKYVFKAVQERKSSGPDNLKGKIIKMCSAQLCSLYTFIFNLSIKEHIIPSIWKCSEIIPVPKKDKISEFNDLRRVLLTSIIMKCLEKILLKELRKYVDVYQDPFQFAYRDKRSVEDAILIF